LKDRLNDVNDEIDYFERRKEELSALILANKDEKYNQEKKISLEKDIIQITKNITQCENRIVNDFSAGAIRFFAAPLISRATKVIENAKIDGEGIPDMRAPAIDFILKRQRCICGCDLSRNEGACENLRKEQKLLPPEYLGTTLRNTKDLYIHSLHEANDFYTTIKENHADYRNNKNYLDEKNAALKSVSAKILGNYNVAKTEQEYQDNEQTLKEKRTLQLKITSDIGATESEINNIERKIESITISSEKNKRLNKCIAYSKFIYEWLKEGYDKQEREVKDRLLTSVNNIFEKMYHGKRNVTINNRYQIILMAMLDSDEVATDESK
jgi:DNA sulfur modification protein DndD